MKIEAGPLGRRLTPGASAFSPETLTPSPGRAPAAEPSPVRFHSPADLPNLHPGAKFETLHVWLARWEELEMLAKRQSDWDACLSAGERQRASRYLRARDAEKFCLGRGWLRHLLGRYLDMRPAAIRLEYGVHGKPFLLDAGAPAPLRFNVAHSGEMMLAVLACRRDVGLDLEQILPEVDGTSVARQFFSPREQLEFFALPAPARQAAFFRAWTCKEAYLKALGTGLARPLDGFAVSLAPDAPARLVAVAWDESEVDGWDFYSWSPGPGYEAAIVVAKTPGPEVWEVKGQ